MQAAAEAEQALLTPASREQLPLVRLLLLYLNPFALFKDASSGPASVRQRALTWNRSMRWMLLAYMRRWLVIAAALFLGIAPAEALAAHTQLIILPAATAVGCCLAMVILACAGVAYLMLGRRPS